MAEIFMDLQARLGKDGTDIHGFDHFDLDWPRMALIFVDLDLVLQSSQHIGSQN